jgi:hypothetical protein
MTNESQPRASRRRLLPAAAAAACIAVLAVPATVIALHVTGEADAGPALAVAAVTGNGGGACSIPAALTREQLQDQAEHAVTAATPLKPGVPAAASLRSLLKRLTAGDCDAQHGRYAYVQVLSWTLDGAVSSGHSRNSLSLSQYQLWRASDDSGRYRSVSTRENTVDETYRRGGLAAFTGKLPASADSPAAAVRAVADLYRGASPDRTVRAATVQLLAATGGLQYHGEVTDRAGRTGLGYSATSNDDAARDLIILDPQTGELLAVESAAMHDPGGLGISRPTALSYQLQVANGWMSVIPGTPS